MKSKIANTTLLVYFLIASSMSLFSGNNLLINNLPHSYLSAIKDSISTDEIQADVAQKIMKASDSMRIVDSLRILVLREELSLVKGSDKTRKREIEIKLRNLL